MKKALVISLAFTLLFVNTTFGEILRLPILVHHYLEHVELDDCSFANFLAIHYVSKIDHPDDHHHDHQRLPFKSTDSHFSPAPGAFIQSIPSLQKLMHEGTKLNKTAFDQQHYSNAFLDSIWQPPRFS